MKRLWIIALLAITILGGSVLAACGDDGLDESLTTLEVGDCVSEADVTGAVEEVETVDCDTEGALEVSAVFDMSGDEWPGQVAVDEASNDACPETTFTYLHPTEESWNGADDREIVCFSLTAEEYTAEQQAAVDYMNSLVTLFNSGEIESFVAEFTDDGLAQFLEDDETPPEELRAQAVEFLGGEMVEVQEFVSVQATDTDATVNLIAALSGILNDETWELEQASEDDFQVAGFLRTTPPFPEGVSEFEVEAVDFGYNFEAPVDGNVALVLTNTGAQFHEVALLRVSDDSPELDELVNLALEAGDPVNLPPEFEEFVTVSFAEPGGSSTSVFANPLTAGRYVMFCFIPDETQGEEGPPHVTLGMSAEFTIE